MGWKPGRWKLNLKEGKDRWLIILAVGLIFLILAFPTKDRSSRGMPGGQTEAGKQGAAFLQTDAAQVQGGEGGGTADAAGKGQMAPEADMFPERAAMRRCTPSARGRPPTNSSWKAVSKSF